MRDRPRCAGGDGDLVVLIGAHVSSAGGLRKALERGEAMGADAVQVFFRSPRAWAAKPHDDGEVAAVRGRLAAGPGPRAMVCHASYLINLASGDAEHRRRSVAALAEDLALGGRLGISGVVVHVGSAKVGDRAEALALARRGLAEAVERAGDAAPLLVENTAGAGGTLGRDFAELAELTEGLEAPQGVGVCLDTQHLWASGVSYATLGDADGVLALLDAAVGLERVRVVHLNDSKVPLGSERDRHENLGEGTIGSGALGALVSHPGLDAAIALVEVPGADGGGPGAADVEAARAVLSRGRAARRRRAARAAGQAKRSQGVG